MTPRIIPSKKNRFLIPGLWMALFGIAIALGLWLSRSSQPTAMALEKPPPRKTEVLTSAGQRQLKQIGAFRQVPRDLKASTSKCEKSRAKPEQNTGAQGDFTRDSNINARLVNGTSAKTQAAGLLLIATSPDFLYCDGFACAKTEKADGARAAAMDKLAEIGALNPQGDEYLWAAQACRLTTPTFKTPAHCSLVTIRRWAELHPENAWAWLSLAAEASSKHDTVDQENYIARALTATDWSNPGQAVALIRARMIDDEDLESKIVDLAGDVRITSDFANASPIFQYCGRNPDANRSQVCLKLATTLAENADSILNLSVAADVAERADGPKEYISRLRSEIQNLQEMYTKTNVAKPIVIGDDVDCEDLQIASDFLEARARLGELSALRLAKYAGETNGKERH